MPDTIGLLADDSRFSFARLYVKPNLTYKTRDINVELSPTTEYLYEKYCHDNGHHQMLFSPDLSVKWYVTPRLRLSLGGSASVEPLDASRFYRSLILQDFQYINQGYAGYRHSHTQAIRGGINYSDALKALHTILTVFSAPRPIHRHASSWAIILFSLLLNRKVSRTLGKPT